MICGLCQLHETARKQKTFTPADAVSLMVGSYWLGQAEATLCKDHQRLLKSAEDAVEATMNDSDAGAH